MELCVTVNDLPNCCGSKQGPLDNKYNALSNAPPPQYTKHHCKFKVLISNQRMPCHLYKLTDNTND